MKRLWIIFVFYCLPAALMPLLFTACSSIQQKYVEEARSGNPQCQAVLGEAYLRGYLFKIDYAEAYVWLGRAAEQGNAVADYDLGTMYQYGLGPVEPNQENALRLYRRSLPGLEAMARQNNIYAKFALGSMYLNGHGVNKDFSKALFFFRNCSQEGFAPAYNSMGEIYQNGCGVSVDKEKAMDYFRRAANCGYIPAYYNLAVNELKTSPDNAEIHMKKASDKGYPPAIAQQAASAEAENKPQEAEKLYLEAAQCGFAPAQLSLGRMMLAQDRKQGIFWIEQAVARGYAPAMYDLSEYYRNSSDNLAKAMVLYNLAQRNGITEAAAKISELDRNTGLYLLTDIVWTDLSSGGEFFLKSDSAMGRVMAGYKAGITTGSRDVFMKELDRAPQNFYLSNDWYVIYKNRLPLAMAGEIFKAVQPMEENTPGFWFAYGTCANLAGQSDFALFAAAKLKTLAENSPELKNRKTLLDIAALIKANALIQKGQTQEAYDFLFVYGKLNRNDTALCNYLKFWANPLLADKKKFSIASGIPDAMLPDCDGMPKKQDFYDAQTGRNAEKNKLPEPQVSSTVLETLRKM